MSISTPNPVLAENWKIENWDGYTAFQEYSTNTALGLISNDPAYPVSISTQNHIDIRTFATSAEDWVLTGTGTVSTGPQSTINHWDGLNLSWTGARTLVLTSDITLPVDVATLDDPLATIALALPTLTTSEINVAGCSISFSQATGGPVSLPFSSSTYSLTNGPTALQWPLSALTGGANSWPVVSVVITIETSGSGSLTMAGLRVLGSAWGLTNVDYDNFDGRLRQGIPIDGDTSLFPVPNNMVFPPLFRTSGMTGGSDPEPIDTEIGFILYTGSSAQANTFSLFVREAEEAYPTMAELQNQLMSTLTGQPQPGPTPTPGSPIWYQFTVGWGSLPYAQVSNSLVPSSGYSYMGDLAPSLSANTYYLVDCFLQDTSARIQIYNLNQTTFAIELLAFDTTVIPDSFLFKRRPGRVGFQAQLSDGDAFIADVRPRSLVFAEYRSDPLQSITPVQGARLYVNETEPVQLWTGWTPYSDTDVLPTLTPNNIITTTGQSTQVAVTAPTSLVYQGGVISNILSLDAITGITNFEQLQIQMDIMVPSVNGTFSASLLSENGLVIPLSFPVLLTTGWNTAVPFLPTELPLQAGLWQIIFYYSGAQAATYYVDNVQITERVIDWNARSVVDDPWDSNYAPWTPFNDLINSDTNGIYFGVRGTNLQLRGQALMQNAVILSAPKLVPRYAQLGRFAWPEYAITLPDLPTAGFTVSGSGLTKTFTDTSTAASDTNLVGWQWDFGDGTFTDGQNVSHTYLVGGTYTVGLTVTDQYGQIDYYSTSVGVS